MSKRFTYSKAPLRRVTEVQFCVWSPDAITAQSMTQEFTTSKGESVPAGVTKAVTFVDGEGVYGGVNDPRMGGDNEREDEDDPGFFGHINLAEPMYNIGYINEVRTILGCVCFHCGTILEDARNAKMRDALKIKHPKARRRAIHQCTKGKRRCFGGDQLDENTNDQRTNDQDDGINGGTRRTIGCGRPQPIKLIKPSADKLFIEFDASDQDIPGNGERRQQLLAKDAHTILKLISDDDIIKLGFHPKYARPEWFIWTVLPVPPPPTRPSVEFGSGISDDDLTHKYINIVKANNALRRSKENGDAPNIQQEVRQKFETGKSWKAV
jgi:DNA-directed RNA polymerase II subunit RPB1